MWRVSVGNDCVSVGNDWVGVGECLCGCLE